MPSEPAFRVDVSPEIQPGQTLVVGLSSLGMTGLTAVDYLVRHLDSEIVGHVSPAEMPSFTPFEDGRPRHHTRLYDLADSDLTVLVGELFVPVWATRSFGDALVEWMSDVRIEEVAILHGVPFPHAPEEHETSHVATDEYRQRRLESASIPPLTGGVLDGVPGELVSRSLDDDAPPTGVYITPAHPPGPDIDAALLLLDAIEEIYGVSVDRTELEELSADIKRHYENLADRMSTLAEEQAGRREFAEDRMFM